MLSKKQKEQLKKPCPLCKEKLTWVGDLADSKHDIVMCENKDCQFALLFNGEIIN